MWWKIYFWLTLALAVVGSLGVFLIPSEVTSVIILEFLIFYLALVGLYSFVFSKHIFSSKFWKFFFWFYLFLDIVYILKVLFPEAPFQDYLSLLSAYEDESMLTVLIGLTLDIPLLIALYKLSKREYRVEENTQANLVPAKNAPKWGMLQTALWGFNTVFTFILFLLSFYPTSEPGGEASDPVSGLAIFAPLLLFWLLVVMQYKMYHWNWWRTTLVANSLLYSAIILYGLATPLPVEPTTSGFDIISTLQIFILFLSLIVFGHDQFKTTPQKYTLR